MSYEKLKNDTMHSIDGIYVHAMGDITLSLFGEIGRIICMDSYDNVGENGCYFADQEDISTAVFVHYAER
ncbi:MAG: hypothetical protein K5879_01800 [Lachnospiraceae bacterium]|nr:hypothetical protein [Lachnospiraceae bacterium]